MREWEGETTCMRESEKKGEMVREWESEKQREKEREREKL